MEPQDQVVLIKKVELEPEPAKLQEVERVEEEFNTRYECLHKRLGKGQVFTDPQDIMSLVTETVDCLLQKLKPHRDKRAIFLLGSSGAGKSLFANWLLGSEIRREMVMDEYGDEVPRLKVVSGFFEVGHGACSKTLVPNVRELPWLTDTILVDFPGFKDTTSLEIRLGIDVALREACKLFKAIHVLALISIFAFEDERGSGARAQLSKLQRLLPTVGMPLGAQECANSENACAWWVGITKCEKPYVAAPRRMFEEARQVLQKESFDGRVLNINQIMSTHTEPRAMRAELCEGTHVACTGGTTKRFEQVFRSAFGELPGSPMALLTDCLNGKDCAKFQKAFMTQEWIDQFVGTPSVKVEVGDLRLDFFDWSKVFELLQKNMEVVGEFVNSIKQDKLAMTQEKRLHTASQNMQVKTLCGYHQCRIKILFLDAEQQVLNGCRAKVVSVVGGCADLAKFLNNEGCLTADELKQVTEQADSITHHMDASLKKEGYSGVDRYPATIVASIGTILAGAGAEQLTWMASASVSSLLPYSLGSVTVAGHTVVLTAGFFFGTFAVAGGIACAIGAGTYSLWRSRQTRKITEQLQQGLAGLERAFDSITEHQRELEAMRRDLAALEILERD